jgi:hypothetical protein
MTNMATEAQCQRALDLFEDELSLRQNVVRSGIVPTDQESPSHRGGMAVAVYVVKKLPSSRLSPRDLVPETLRLPSKRGIVEVPTRVIEQETLRLETAG